MKSNGIGILFTQLRHLSLGKPDSIPIKLIARLHGVGSDLTL